MLALVIAYGGELVAVAFGLGVTAGAGVGLAIVGARRIVYRWRGCRRTEATPRRARSMSAAELEALRDRLLALASAHAVAQLAAHFDGGLVWRRYGHALPDELARAAEVSSRFRAQAASR